MVHELAEELRGFDVFERERQDFIRRFNAAGTGIPGHVSSWFRTAKRNREIGGAKHSQHLYGLAMDVVVPVEWRARTIERMRGAGFWVLDEGDHIHVQRFTAQEFMARRGLVGSQL